MADPNVDPITPTPTGEGTPAESAPAGSLPAGDESTPATETTPEEKGGFQTRIDQLTKEKHDAIRDAAYYKGQVEAKVAPAPKAAAEAKELDPDDFASDADYIKARGDQVEEGIKKRAADKEVAERKVKDQGHMRDQYGKGRVKHADFDAVALTQGTHTVTETMFDAAKGDNLADILYELGKAPGEADRIATLTPTQQIKAIGRIEDRITASPASTTTGAPNPPTTVGGGGSPTPKPDEEKSQAELNATWTKELEKEIGV